MARKRIYVFNDPVLRKKARPVNQLSGTVLKLIEDMFETMYSSGGIGLAAPQVGVSKRIFVVDTRDLGEKVAMINPKLIYNSKKELSPYKEGCLSLPGIEAEILRPRRVTVQYLDPQGKEKILEADGLLARVIQHENDHLDGVLMVDRVTDERERKKLMAEIQEMERAVPA